MPPFPGVSNENRPATLPVHAAPEKRWLIGPRRSRARTSLTYIEGKFRENRTRNVKNFSGEWYSRELVLVGSKVGDGPHARLPWALAFRLQ